MTEHWEQLKNGAPLFSNLDKKEILGYENKLVWDDVQKTMVLTVDAVSNRLRVNLEGVQGSKDNANVFLQELSLLLYEHILRKKPAVLREKTKYFLHYDMTNRNIIYNCLIDLIKYAFYSGGNILAYQPGVNMSDGEVLDIEKMRDERVMSYVTDSLLKTNTLVDRNFVEYFELPDKEEMEYDTW